MDGPCDCRVEGFTHYSAVLLALASAGSVVLSIILQFVVSIRLHVKIADIETA